MSLRFWKYLGLSILAAGIVLAALLFWRPWG